LLLSLALVLLVTQCNQDQDPNDPIKTRDQAFLDALLEGTPDGEGNLLIIDTNGDGQISYAEAEVVTYLDVSGKGIIKMDGIEDFINLEHLYCHFNQIQVLDLTENMALETLSCWGNRLSILNVSNNTELKVLDCSFNLLLSLDVSQSRINFMICKSYFQLAILKTLKNRFKNK